MELLEDAGYLAFWVRLRLCDFQHGMRRTFQTRIFEENEVEQYKL